MGEKFQNFIAAIKEDFYLKYDSLNPKFHAIPVNKKIPETKNNFAIVGDAASHTKATTGGGVVFGIKASHILAEVASQTAQGKAKLEDFQKRMKDLHKELDLHYKIRKYLNRMSDPQLEKLLSKIGPKETELIIKYGDMDYASTLMKLPIMLKFFKEFIHFMLS
jgi:flavin-dependent dehydrogenase